MVGYLHLYGTTIDNSIRIGNRFSANCPPLPILDLCGWLLTTLRYDHIRWSFWINSGSPRFLRGLDLPLQTQSLGLILEGCNSPQRPNSWSGRLEGWNSLPRLNLPLVWTSRYGRGRDNNFYDLVSVLPIPSRYDPKFIS